MPLIEWHTKKIIDLQVANIFCAVCNKSSNNEEHVNCFKNYSGTSKGMEAFLNLKGVETIDKKYEMHVNEIIADGDSNSYKNIINNVD